MERYIDDVHAIKVKTLIEQWEFRHGRRLPLQELAQATGIKAQTLSAMSNPAGYVTNTRYAESLCRFFDVTPNDLFMFNPPLALAPPTAAAQDPQDRMNSAAAENPQ